MSKNRQLSFISRGAYATPDRSARGIRHRGFVLLATLIVGLSLCVVTAAVRATPVLIETAAPPTSTAGAIINDGIWLFHRFQITTSSQLKSVGGTFVNFSNSPLDVFGAIVGLTGPYDFPDSLDLSTPDLLGTNLVTIAPSDSKGAEFENDLSLYLGSGWYALGFGSGAFDASNVPAPWVWVGMPDHSVDLAQGQIVFSAFQPEYSSLGFLGQSVSARFLATFAVPEPTTMALLVLGLAIIVASSSRARRARGVGIRTDR